MFITSLCGGIVFTNFNTELMWEYNAKLILICISYELFVVILNIFI